MTRWIGIAGALALVAIAAWRIFGQQRPPQTAAVKAAPPPPTAPPPVAPPPEPVSAPPAILDAGVEAAEDAGGAGEVEAAREDPPDEDNGDFYSYERTVVSAVVETATGRRIPLADEAGWEAIAITGADGGLRAVAYLLAEADTPTACGEPRFLIIEPDGGVGSRIAWDGRSASQSGPFAVLSTPQGRVATIAGERALVENIAGAACSLPPSDAGVTTPWALVDPGGSLRPMRTIVVP